MNTTLERRNYAQHISNSIKAWLKNSSEDIDELQLNLILEKAIKEDRLDILPEDVKNKFILDDCIIEVPYNKGSIKKLTENIIDTISDIESKTSEYELSNCGDEKGTEVFWIDITDRSSFFSVPNKKLKNKNGENLHDTEKPIELMKILISNSSKPSQIVMNPFLGIGSSGIASLELNRNFIGCEIDTPYFLISEKRLQQTYDKMISLL